MLAVDTVLHTGVNCYIRWPLICWRCISRGWVWNAVSLSLICGFRLVWYLMQGRWKNYLLDNSPPVIIVKVSV